MSQTTLVLIAAAVLVGIVTAFFLYRAAHAKRSLDVDVLDVKRLEVDTSGVPTQVRERIENIQLSAADREKTVQELSKIVQEETKHLLEEMKQEYSVKYQVVVNEKNREVESVKRDYTAVQQRYQKVEKLYKEVDEQKKQTEAVVKSIAEGLVVVNQKGEVLLMNPSAERLLGVKKEEKIGRSILDDVGDQMMISMAREAGDEKEKVIEFKSKDENTRKILRSSGAVIQNENGQTVGMVNILTDVTKQRELDEIKDSFVSNVTHEFRTPIVAMQKATSLLLGHNAGPLNDQQQNFLGIVFRNLQHLSRLVEDLLDIAKLDSGKMRFKMSSLRLDKLVAEACDTLDTWARSKEIQIVRDLERNLPEMTLDPTKVTQVLNNLIGNAVKFTPNGGKVTVKCQWSPDGTQALISVSDTGVGIAKENLPKLFGRFQQFGDQQGISGTGLGLAISKEIVERHGGKIWVESKEQKGATFLFTLPLRPVANLANLGG